MDVLIKYLQEFGLNVNEAKVYSTLLTNQVRKASEIAKISGIPRNKIYEISENLSKKGFLEILPEKVKKFRAIPLEESIKMQIEKTDEKKKIMEQTKNKMKYYIDKLTVSEIEESGNFTIYKSKQFILKKIRKIFNLTEKKLYLMFNSSDLRRFLNDGKNLSNSININVIAPVIKNNMFLVKKWFKFSDFKHYNIENQMKIIIRDDEEILLFKLDNPIALFSKDKRFIDLFKTFFNSIWEHSIDVKKKINQIEKGKPIEEIKNIKGRKEFFETIKKLINETKKEILVATTYNGIIRIHKFLKKELQDAFERGVKIRILIPVNKKNLKYVKKTNFAKIRHIDSVPSVISCFDNKYILMVQIEKDNTSLESDEDIAIIFTQKSITKTINNLLCYMWDSAIDVSKLDLMKDEYL